MKLSEEQRKRIHELVKLAVETGQVLGPDDYSEDIIVVTASNIINEIEKE